MNSQQTQLVINLFLKSLTQRDLQGLGSLFSEVVDWYIPGDESNVPWLGKRNTKQEVIEFYENLWKNTQPVSAQIDTIFVDGTNAIITGEFSTLMLATDKIVNSPFSIQITVENDLIIKYRLLEDSYAVSMAMRK